MATGLPNKREILQPILDKTEQGWSIIKPSPLDPTDPEERCVFQKGNKEAEISIPNSWFQDLGERHKIEPVLRDAIRSAKVKT